MSLNYLATRFRCNWPWNTLVMLCDGRIVCGCADPYAHRVLGDVRASSVHDVWSGETITRLRGELNAGGSKFCGDCSLKTPLKRDEAPPVGPLGADGVGALPQRGARLHRVIGDELVEVAPAHDVAVGREHRVLRPLELERDAVGDGAQAVEAMVVAGDRVLEAHVGELLDGARRQPVAARLVARERLALDDHDVVAGFGEPVRGGRARRATPDDEHVVHGATCCCWLRPRPLRRRT